MKLTKSLLLASAAGLAAVATASAADLPSKKAAPVEYVKVCPAFGPGFYYIPGSDTCLKISGNVWVEGMWAQPYTKAQDTLGYRTQMRITLDARTNTEYGLLRTVVDPRFNKRNGNEASPSQTREGNAANGTNGDGTTKQFQVNTTTANDQAALMTSTPTVADSWRGGFVKAVEAAAPPDSRSQSAQEEERD